MNQIIISKRQEFVGWGFTKQDLARNPNDHPPEGKEGEVREDGRILVRSSSLL